MDKTRLREGTKIKLTYNNYPKDLKLGEIGFLTKGSCYHHRVETIEDSGGHYWFRPRREGTEHTMYCISDGSFKVLKY